MTNSTYNYNKNYNKNQKKTHKLKVDSKKKVEHTKNNKKKLISKKKHKIQNQNAGTYEDTKMFDFMKVDMKLDKPNRQPMPEAPCCIL